MENTQPNLHYYWNKGIPYVEYKEVIRRQAKDGKDSPDEAVQETSGHIHLNISRMSRNDKTLVLEDLILSELKKLKRKINLLIISEGWCGDAAQSVPVVNKLAENSDKLEMKIIFRDENENLINHYLTNGGKAIPIIILLDAENFSEIAHWGPRPKPLLPLIQKYKENPETYTHDNFVVDLQNFYNLDKGHAVAEELVNIISKH
ncbi:MAG: thioredoxin family protein [Flavobacteriaceae bacterium]|jgi:hypothetical protein|nr:thioredoxin family protein [Flavobacteriaceae bacterium]